MIKKVIIDEKGNKFYYKEGDFHSKFGIIKENDIKNGYVKSHLGKEFIIFDSNFLDDFSKIKRGPAITHSKDIGSIISNTGIGVGSKVLDAGTGQGGMAIYLARIGCEVFSYEKNKEFFEIAKENVKNLKLKIKLENRDIYEGISERDLDLVFLDLLEPWNVLEFAYESLKSGSFLVCYLPTITQVIKLVEENKNFYLWKVSETIEREWIVKGLKIRPENMILGHTAFIVYLRKI